MFHPGENLTAAIAEIPHADCFGSSRFHPTTCFHPSTVSPVIQLYLHTSPSTQRIGQAQTAACHQSQVATRLGRRLSLGEEMTMRKAHNAFHHEPGVVGIC